MNARNVCWTLTYVRGTSSLDCLESISFLPKPRREVICPWANNLHNTRTLRGCNSLFFHGGAFPELVEKLQWKINLRLPLPSAAKGGILGVTKLNLCRSWKEVDGRFVATLSENRQLAWVSLFKDIAGLPAWIKPLQGFPPSRGLEVRFLFLGAKWLTLLAASSASLRSNYEVRVVGKYGMRWLGDHNYRLDDVKVIRPWIFCAFAAHWIENVPQNWLQLEAVEFISNNNNPN